MTALADGTLLVLAALFGASIGSFVATLADRWFDERASALSGRSHCQACGHQLTAVELVPVASWLIQRGRCRTCGARLDPMLLVSELTAAAIALAAFALLPPVVALVITVLGWWLLLLALLDARTLILPDRLTLPMIAGGLLAGPGLWPSVVGAATGWAAFVALGLAYRRLRGREGLGGGDAKLLAAAGAWLGVQWLPLVVLIGALVGLALAWPLGAYRTPERPIPFGSCLALSFWCCALGERAGLIAV